jgi:hypothetical protein
MKSISSSGSILERTYSLFHWKFDVSTPFNIQVTVEDRYINHWKKILFNDDNKNGGNKLRTYRKLKNSYKMEKFLHSDVNKFALSIFVKPSLRKVFSL